MSAQIIAVARDGAHRFSKVVMPSIDLVAGLGVAGDAHAGETVKHRSRVRTDPTQPNLRQVHLIQSELFDDLSPRGFILAPGDLGENITTCGIDLMALPRGTILSLGKSAQVEVTGLRNPCAQIETFRKGLLSEVLLRGQGRLVRRAGIMGIVLTDGEVAAGDRITVSMPSGPHQPLERV